MNDKSSAIAKKIRIVAVNLLNNSIIGIQLFLKPVRLMSIDKLNTKNRLDINLRAEFLKQVVNNGKKINNTRYYKFMQVFDEMAYGLNPDTISKNFISLCKNIEKNGFKGYFVVAKPNRFNHIEIIFKNCRKISNKKVKPGYQLVGGAHRLAACKFLGYKEIPVKVISSPFLDFPDFTSFIKRYRI